MVRKRNACFPFAWLMAASLPFVALSLRAEETRIEVDASQVIRRIPRTLTGVCIEDVNHEIYGGLYSQMIFGESFQEPAGSSLAGFQTFGGVWKITADDELTGQGDAYPKAVSQQAPLSGDSQAGVDIRFDDARDAVAGLIFHVEDARLGVDDFSGYEVALNPGAGIVRLARHRNDYHLIRDVKCLVPVRQWVRLSVKMTGSVLEVAVDGKRVIEHDDGGAALRAGAVGLRQAHPAVRYRRLSTKKPDGSEMPVPFEQAASMAAEMSGEWRGSSKGTARGETRLERDRPFVGNQSQRLTFVGGEGEVSVANLGLYGRPVAAGRAAEPGGMSFSGGKPYEGCLWVRAENSCGLTVALENADGTQTRAESILRVRGGDEWQRLAFTLTPKDSEARGRFAVKLTAPGSVVLGYALLQPGEWGRFKSLPVRRDVVEGLLDQGVTVMRYGGSMVNAEGYRWKHMIGPREKRPPYRGLWYPYSTNGWAVPDFLNLCEAMGIPGIPDLNVNETPQDVADFIEYANGPAESPWGRQRAADGHPAPYGLRHLELGNEEKVDEAYWRKFQPLAEAVWAKDSQIILVVGDFAYNRPIVDPFQFSGADSGITTLEAHRKILALARQHEREVWFDVHVNTEVPDPASGSFQAFPSYVGAIGKLAEGARHRVACFELNANTHDQRRALANAAAILLAERLGEQVPVVTSANGLQPDGHNDNGWNQGLLFLNPAQVWLQPPGYAARMMARHYEPLLVRSSVTPGGAKLDVCAARSKDGRALVLQVVNATDRPASARLALSGFASAKVRASGEQLTAPPSGVNTAQDPARWTPQPLTWQPGSRVDDAACAFAPHSFSILRLER